MKLSSMRPSRRIVDGELSGECVRDSGVLDIESKSVETQLWRSRPPKGTSGWRRILAAPRTSDL